ncbi:hypothetical protein JTB14_037056 [Gonioctena quinquepunctata]|nr:hypothetical protein JTB14_037056 [Gonioctena quinquepunctata]
MSFASRILSRSEMKYSGIHKEALAIYWALRKFYQYLMGDKFILCSDHKPLKEDGGAGGLSRSSVESFEPPEVFHDYFIFLIEDEIPIEYDDIIEESRTDIILSKVYEYVQDGWPDIVPDELKPHFRRMSELSIDDGLLMWGYRVLIPGEFRIQMLD